MRFDMILLLASTVLILAVLTGCSGSFSILERPTGQAEPAVAPVAAVVAAERSRVLSICPLLPLRVQSQCIVSLLQ